MSAQDSIETQKEIFGKVQSLMAFLDATDKKMKRENLEAWKEVLEALREITNNPLPLLLELLKLLRSKKSSNKPGAAAKAFKAAKEKIKKGKEKLDNKFKTTAKSFSEKFHLDMSGDVWLRTLNQIIRESILEVLPRVDDILLEEIIKAFGCDVNMLIPTVGDGISAPNGIEIPIENVDLLKQLFNDPNSKVGKYMYEADSNIGGFYPPGQSPYPLNRLLRDITFNGGASFATPGTTQTVYGASGRPLFDITASAGIFAIKPYYKDGGAAANYQSAPTAAIATATKFTFIEFLKDYFGNIKLIETQNLLAAILEILSGFMSVRNKNFSVEDLLGLEEFMAGINNILESCDGMDMETSTDSMKHQSELYNDDSFFEFSVEEKRQITLEATRKSQNVISLQSCGAVDIPIDNDLVDDGLEEILASLNKDEELKAFDLVLSKIASSSAKKYGIDISLGEIALPVEIDFKETLIKKLPQILMYCILNPKGILPVVLTARLLNQNTILTSSLAIWMRIFKRVLIRVVKEFLAAVAQKILAILKQILLRMIQDFIKRKLDEKTKKKIRIIRKLLDILLPLIIGLQEAKSCQDIYNLLLGILAANMPDIPFGVPPFLLAAAKLRPGTSALGATEKVINKMLGLGLPIGDLPDGSSNRVVDFVHALNEGNQEENSDNAGGSGVILNAQVIHWSGPGAVKPFTQFNVVPY